MRLAFSTTMTLLPKSSFRRMAAYEPLAPPPMMATSRVMISGSQLVALTAEAAARRPLARRRAGAMRAMDEGDGY